MTIREQLVKAYRDFPVGYRFRRYDDRTLGDIQHRWAYPPSSIWHTTYGNRYFNLLGLPPELAAALLPEFKGDIYA